MAGNEAVELETFHDSIYNKYKYSGIASLTPSEVCLTLLSPSWEYFFLKETKTSWFSIVGNYKSVLVSHLKQSSPEHLKARHQENIQIRQQAGKKFLELLDLASVSHVGSISDPTLKDDHALERLKETLTKKNLTLTQVLLKNDENHDGFMNKSEFITALESLSLPSQDIVALIRVAGYRPGVDLIPISGFSDFLTRRGEDRKKEEFALFTKLINALTAKGRTLGKAFALLDTNQDGVITVDEFRAELGKMGAGLNFGEIKEIFAIIDVDKSGSISLDELKNKLNALLPAKDKKEGKKGLIVINVLKGQKFKPLPRSVKVKYGTAEFVSAVFSDANPEFKFKNTFESGEGKEIEIEVLNGKKVEGKGVVSLSEISKTEELKKKLDILGSNKLIIGTLLIKASLTEVAEANETVSLGSVLFTLVKGDASVLPLKLKAYNRIYTLSQSSFSNTLTLSGLKKDPNERLVLGHSLENPEHDLDLFEVMNSNGRSPVEFKFGAKKIYMQVLWEDFDEEDEKEFKAAAKIQKMWRIYSILNSTRLKAGRKLINKKTATYNKRRYLLGFFKVGKDVEIEVHPADTSVGIDTVLSVNRFPGQDLNEILSGVTLKPDFKLGSVLAKTWLRGNLYIDIVKVLNLHESLIVFNFDGASIAVNPKEKSSVEFYNLSFSQIPAEIDCKIVNSHSKSSIGQTKLYWMHAINNSEKWTENTTVYVRTNSSFIIRARWENLPDISKEEHAAIVIQKNWRAKKEREELKLRLRKSSLVARKAYFENRKIYLVSITSSGKNWNIQLHPADNPQVPTYEVIDKLTVAEGRSPSEVFEKLKIQDEKLKLGN